MIEDLGEQLKIFIGLIGAFAVAMLGVLARLGQTDGGITRRLIFLEMPFAALCCVVAGGIGDLLDVPATVAYAIAGAFAYLGGEWFRNWLKERFSKKPGADKDAPPEDHS